MNIPENPEIKRCRKIAERAVLESGKKHCILNLNRVGLKYRLVAMPLYLVREYHPSMEQRGSGYIIESFVPQDEGN